MKNWKFKKSVFICGIFAIVFGLCSATMCYAETVMYNTQTHKYHQIWCRYAAKCTVNCIKLEKKEAIKRGGVPCKVCGG